jgi:hypothetical protein
MAPPGPWNACSVAGRRATRRTSGFSISRGIVLSAFSARNSRLLSVPVMECGGVRLGALSCFFSRVPVGTAHCAIPDSCQYLCAELLQFAISILTLMWCQRALHSHPCHGGGNEWDAAYGMGVSFDGWVLGISVFPLDSTGVSPGRAGFGGRVAVLTYIWP